MQTIKYYDEINGKEIEVEVTDAVAEELRKMKNNKIKKDKEIKANEFSINRLKEGQDLLIDKSDNPLEALIKKEDENIRAERRKELFKKALQTLTTKERELINMIFYKKYTQAEVAKKLKVKRSTICNRYSNAINKLRRYITINE